MASHPLDLQSFPGDSEPHITVAHVGPPAPNVEVKLVGVLDTSVEKGGDPTGDVRCYLVISPACHSRWRDSFWSVVHQSDGLSQSLRFKILKGGSPPAKRRASRQMEPSKCDIEPMFQ